MKRIRLVVLSAAACLALAAPSFADPANLSYDDNNARRVIRVEHPTINGWYANLRLDNHFAFDEASGDLVGTSPVAVMADGPGALRYEVSTIRVRVDEDDGVPDRVINDHFPSANANVRTNTRVSCQLNATITGGLVVVAPGVTARLYDEADPPGAEPKNNVCETATEAPAGDLLRNPLNNAFDFSPNVATVRSYGDIVDLVDGAGPDSGVVSQRTFVRVRWNNGDLSAHNYATGEATYSS